MSKDTALHILRDESRMRWNAVSGWWAKRVDAGGHADPMRDRVLTPYIQSAAPRAYGGGRALDVGCGEGYASRLLMARGWRVTACDWSDQMVAMARQRGVDAVMGDLEGRLPFADAEFDFVFGSMVLMDVLALETACRELLRVTRPGGAGEFIVLDPDSFAEDGMPVFECRWIETPGSGRSAAWVRMAPDQPQATLYCHRNRREYEEAFGSAGWEVSGVQRLAPTRAVGGEPSGSPLSALTIKVLAHASTSECSQG